MIENGFRPHQPLTGAQEAALLRFDCACNFLSQHGVAIDIHWELIDPHQGFAIDTKALRERLEPVTVNGRQLVTLSSEDLLLFLCLHGFTHFWERLSWICDVAALAQSGAKIDWNQLLQTAETNGALRILLLGLWLAHDVLKAPLPEDVLKAAQSDEVVQQVAKEVAQQLFATTRKANGLFGEAALLMRLRERKRDKLRSFLSWLGAPRSYDWLWISFPQSLSFLYYLIRPVRLAAKYGSQIFQSADQ